MTIRRLPLDAVADVGGFGRVDYADDLQLDARWQQVPAVRKGRILVLDTLRVGRPGIKLGEAAWSLARLLHANELK